MLPDGWLKDAESAGACVIRNKKNRGEMLEAILERLGQPAVDPELAADFLALGFCHFHVEVMSQQLRYMSSLDASSLETSALSAAKSAISGDAESARKHLQSAFDRLHEAREYSYSSYGSTRFLDLTLTAPGTLGEDLRAEMRLANSAPRNLLISGNLLDIIAERHPATLDAIRRAVDEKRLGLIGGEYVELPLPMLDLEAIETNLRRGLAAYERHLVRRPTCFGRRRFGLTAGLPQVLCKQGFKAAMHFTLDDGQFPVEKCQSRVQWEGLDGTAVEAAGRVPLDAARADSFLKLSELLGDALNIDSAGTLIFAHWPDRVSPWYDDLRRASAYGAVLGEFLAIDDYFDQTYAGGRRGRYTPDQYRLPYLVQDVAADRPDAVSRWVRYYRQRAALAATQWLRTMTALVLGKNDELNISNDELAAALEAARDGEPSAREMLNANLSKTCRQALDGFARVLGGDATDSHRGVLIVNPWSFPALPPSALRLPFSEAVPAMGFCFAPDGVESESPRPVERRGWFGRRKQIEPPPLAEQNVLRNEFFEVRFDPISGCIQTISDYRSRNPRLAQQIALRIPQPGVDPDSESNYTTMQADAIAVSLCTPTLGEMQVRGSLLDGEGRRAAGFRQTTRLRRGSRVLEILIELDLERQPEANPWNSYYAARWAWKDESAEVRRDVHLSAVATDLMRFESPRFLVIADGPRQTALMTGGLPYHRRIGLRKLDTLLIVRGETSRSFWLGAAIDPPSVQAAALGFIHPPLELAVAAPPGTPSGWLFHLDCRNVLAGGWAPCVEGEKVAGFRVCLQETEGRGTRLGLRCFRDVASARRLSAEADSPKELSVSGDRIDIDIGPCQWLEVEGRFATGRSEIALA